MLKLRALLATDRAGRAHAAQGALLSAQAWQGRQGLLLAVATSQLSSVRSTAKPLLAHNTAQFHIALQAESPSLARRYSRFSLLNK